MDSPHRDTALLDAALAALAELGEGEAGAEPTGVARGLLRVARSVGVGEAALWLEGEGGLWRRQGDAAGPTLLLAPDLKAYLLALGGQAWSQLEDPHPAVASFWRTNAEALQEAPRHLWLPLASGRRLLGLFMLGAPRQGEALGPREREALAAVGRTAAAALRQARMAKELQGANLQLALKVRQLEQLHDIGMELGASLERRRITKELLIRAVELVDARQGALVWAADGDRPAELAQSFGEGAPQVAPEWALGVARPGLVAHVQGHELPEGLGAQTGLVVPIASRSRHFGALAVFDKEDRRGVGPFSEDDESLLVGLATQAATALENARLYEMATVDGLTKLYIRRHFEQRQAEEHRRFLRHGTPYALLLLDLDRFKAINDTHGHATGDLVLKEVAAVMRAKVREDLDVPGRYGGEELLVLMPETEEAGATIMAERLRAAVEGLVLQDPTGAPLRVTASFGVACCPQDGQEPGQLMEAADRALYAAKHGGRNQVRLASTVAMPTA